MVSFKKRVSYVAVAFVTMLQMSGLTLLMPTTARAAEVCINDIQGANDDPGQKDLTKLCFDDAGLPTTFSVTWQWDKTSWSGANTGDACALFDTDGDGLANYAACLSVGGNTPAIEAGYPQIFSCNDTRPDRCAGPSSSPAGATSCSVNVAAVDPFPAGESYPNDTLASCTIPASVVGATSASLLDVCTIPSQQANSDPSDCIEYDSGTGKIEVRKVVSPANSDTFALLVNGTTFATVGNGGTTGELVIDDGSVTVGEANGSGNLAQYSSSVSCRDLNGTGSVIASSTTTSVQFTLVDKADVVCTITNTRLQGSVSLVKNVINDNGGTLGVNSFGLTIGGQGVTSGQIVSLPSGVPVAITESGAIGYNFISISGSGCPTQLGGTVTPVAGQTITCTITNNDIAPQLTVIKQVSSLYGGNNGPESFTMNVTGTDVSQTSFAGSSTGTTVSLDAGSYSVSESPVSGYTPSYSADCSGTIAIGETKTCTVTNTEEQGTLTIVKNVTNDDGGTLDADDFGITIGTATPVFGNASSDSGSTKTYRTAIATNSNQLYTIAEVDTAGYTEGTWSCTDGTVGQGLSVSVTLDEGEDVTCEITNNDQPPFLTVLKQITGNNGGLLMESDFPLFVGTTSVTHNQQTDQFDAGTYTITETQQPGYRLTGVTGNCTYSNDVISIGLTLGNTFSCTLINEEIAPKLTLRKEVVNDNGGAAEPQDWTLTATPSDDSFGTISGNGLDGVEEVVARANLSYTLSEDGPSGYEAGSWDCGETANLDGNVLTLELAENVTCTIVNDDIAPTIFVSKQIYGDYNEVFDFTVTTEETDFEDEFQLSGDWYSYEPVAETEYELRPDAGTVTITENVDSSEWLTFYSCKISSLLDDSTPLFGRGTSVTFAVGPGAEGGCYFQNIQRATVTVTKYSDLNQNGVWDENEPKLPDWDMQLALSAEEFFGLPAYDATFQQTTNATGSTTFTVLEQFADYYEIDFEVSETLKAGWKQTGISCDVVHVEYPEREGEVILDRGDNIALDVVDDVEGTNYLMPGSTAECYVGNYLEPIVIVKSATTLSKTGSATTVALMVVGSIMTVVAGLEVARRKN